MLATDSQRTACPACAHPYAADALFCPNCGTARVRDYEGDPLIGARVGERYLLTERIGMGASGTIYRGEHVTLRRRVAVKVLHHELSRDDLAIERFRRQATTVSELENEHIVQIHDFGRAPDGRLYIAMEYLEGETLDERLERLGRLEVADAVDILIQLGEALTESHAIGYVHRDLRPRNLFLAVRRGSANFLKLLDFGLSKLVAAEGEAASTSLGMTFGDPHYMSPEQARGQPIDRRADLYSMGCIAYQMLAGEPPFTGDKVFDVLSKQVEEAPVPLAERAEIAVPEWLDQTISRCLAKAPEDRFVTVFRLVEALRRGLASGEVMDEERARSRETELPPSVSRVMQRLGDRLGADGRIDDADDTRSPLGAQTVLGIAAPGVARRPASSGGRIVSEMIDPDPTEPTAMAPEHEAVPSPVAVEPTPAPRPRGELVSRPVVRAPEAPPADDDAEDDEGDELDELDDDSAELGAYEDDDDEAEDLRRTTERPPSGAGFRRGAASSGAGISSAWYADGEALADSGVELEDQELARLRRARRGSRRGASLSGTGELYYDEGSGRWKWVAAAAGVAVAVLALIWVIRGGGGGEQVAATAGPALEQPEPAAAAPEPGAAAAHATDAARASDPEPEAAEPAPVRQPAVAAREPAPAPARRSNPEPAPVRRPAPAAPEPARDPDPEPAAAAKPEPEPASEPDGASGDDDKRRASFFAQVGRKHLSSGDLPSAAKEFRKALALNAADPVAVTGLGEIALRSGSYQAAVQHLRRAARLRSGNSTVHTMLGEAHLGTGDRAAAAESFKQALRLSPESDRARRGLADAGGSQ
jgi:serine/threonine-protein kinase